MATNGTTHTENMSKDEVGWYFVEQYYTTLSKNPNRLHLFYGKKSQLVYGNETEVATVSIGRQDIQDRIIKLDFQDCKVRVSNVDTQSSADNILIQVIGEISNKAEESRKFVQTFILAEQPSGYFVLNDIFRYIKEEEAESTEAAAAATAEKHKAAPEEAKSEEAHVASAKTEESEAVKPQLDAAVVDKKLEEVNAGAKEPAATPAVAMPAEHVAAKPAEPVVPAVPAVPAAAAAVATPTQAPNAEKVAQEVAEEEQKKTEAPKEPASTPAVARVPIAASAPAPAPAPAPPAAASAEPEKPKGPPKPMTWASRAAAAAGTARSVALPKPAPAAAAPASPATSAATSTTAATTKPATTPAAAAPAPAAAAAATTKPTSTENAAPAATAAAVAAAAAAGKESRSEWQTAGADTKRQNRPQSISGPLQDKDTALGYVKYVTDKVDEETLRNHLETFGHVVYFDINRTKNCAFIEFASPAGYQAAVAANPHTINGENILVEARRPKASAYGGANYNPNRGNLASRGRGGYEGRNGSQGGGRGGFSGQNRGRGGAGGPGGASRGRGGAQSLAA